jgi:hypothetical protein
VSGSCEGYAKPSWQVLTGVPDDKVRDLPDVSLFAADGIWGHYYVMCWSDVRGGGARCTGAPSTWAGAGGTSFASPIMAGIQALVNQSTGSKQGNPNAKYYQLAAAEYGNAGSSTCNSTLGNAAGSGCIFYNVTLGDIVQNCSGTDQCYGATTATTGTGRGGGGGRHTAASPNGALSTSSATDSPAFNAGTGWNFGDWVGECVQSGDGVGELTHYSPERRRAAVSLR